MKQVKIKQLTLINFKGHRGLTVNFSDVTNISGENATGKSTIFDAFVWLLFGKDQFDRKDFEIIPTQDGKRADRVNPEVSAVLEFEGREMTIKRVLNQKWVRKRGTAGEVFDGCDTLYYFNDVPLKAGEYKARIDLIIEETVFKLITNPSTFLGLHWTKQREFLFQIGGTLSDNDIAATNPAFSKLLDLINGRTLIEFKKELSARKKKLKDDLENIQPRIDQTTRLMPENRDFKAIENEIAEIDNQIKAIDLEISDKAAAIRGQYDEIQGKQAQINALKIKQMEVVNALESAEQKKVFEQNTKRNEIINEGNVAAQVLKSATNELDSEVRALDSLNKKRDSLNNELSELRAKWQAESEKEYKEKEGCLICPLFGNECADANAIEHSKTDKESAKKSFFEAKDAKLNQINSDGLGKKEQLTFLNTGISDAEKNISELTLKVKNYNETVGLLRQKIAQAPLEFGNATAKTSIPEWVELESQIADIEATIEASAPVNTSDLSDRKSEYNRKRDELNKQLGDRSLIEKYTTEVKSLEKQGSDIAQQIADLENTEFTIDAFNKVKIDQLESGINNMFRIVKFKLFDKTNDGNEFEACIPTNKAGVPISATNTAEQINAGIDIISTLSKFYNVSAPVFLDGAESNNSPMKLDAQMVFLRVSKEQVLTIN